MFPVLARRASSACTRRPPSLARLRSSAIPSDGVPAAVGAPLPPVYRAEGLLAVNKPLGWTSQDVVAYVRQILLRDAKSRGALPNARRRRKPQIKVGHGGTLDPLATGVLVLGVGSAGTRTLGSFLSGGKRYACEASFGFETDSLDLEGKVVAEADTAGVVQKVEGALEGFRGQIEQVPPMFSALKVGGRRMHEIAREGGSDAEELVIKTRSVMIYGIEVVGEGDPDADNLQSIVDVDREARRAAEAKEAMGGGGTEEEPDNDRAGEKKKRNAGRNAFLTSDSAYAAMTSADSPPPTVRLAMSVGGGTYVRSLVRDLGKAVGSRATMTGLVRCMHGPFSITDCLSVGPDEWTADVLYGAVVSPNIVSEGMGGGAPAGRNADVRLV